MSRKFYTILILPHANARLRKIHVSRGFVLTLAGILVATLTAFALAPHLLFKMHGHQRTITRLQESNEQLLAEKQRIEERLSLLTENLSRFEESAGRLAEALGVEDLPAPAPAAGGSDVARPPHVSLQEAIEEDLDVLNERANRLGESYDTLDEAWLERWRQLASTPSVFPVRGFFSHGYGWRKDPFTGEREFHQGVDIVADRGTPVVATADGVVTRATRYMGYGKMVHISHGYGMATRYGHLNEILVRPGQRVSRGDVIGRVGSTGRSTGPHLHYEVFKAGRREDPRRYLGDRKY